MSYKNSENELVLKNTAVPPCPFCGKEIDVLDVEFLHRTGTYWHDTEHGRSYTVDKEDNPCWVLSCVEIYGGCGASMYGDTLSETISNWTKRVSPILDSSNNQFVQHGFIICGGSGDREMSVRTCNVHFDAGDTASLQYYHNRNFNVTPVYFLKEDFANIEEFLTPETEDSIRQAALEKLTVQERKVLGLT